MVYLHVHLANEAKVAGPVQYLWMYPIERYVIIQLIIYIYIYIRFHIVHETNLLCYGLTGIYAH